MPHPRKNYGLSIRLPLTDEVHTALRIAAAKNGVAKGYAIMRMVEDWLQRHKYLPRDEAPPPVGDPAGWSLALQADIHEHSEVPVPTFPPPREK
jgi:hypothetical protein